MAGAGAFPKRGRAQEQTQGELFFLFLMEMGGLMPARAQQAAQLLSRDGADERTEGYEIGLLPSFAPSLTGKEATRTGRNARPAPGYAMVVRLALCCGWPKRASNNLPPVERTKINSKV